MKYAESVQILSLKIIQDEIHLLEQKPTFSTFGLSGKAKDIIDIFFHTHFQIEKKVNDGLFTSKSSYNEFRKEINAIFFRVIKFLFLFLNEPLNGISKVGFIDSFKEYLSYIKQLNTLLYKDEIENILQSIKQLKDKFLAILNSQTENPNLTNSINEVIDLSLLLVNDIAQVVIFTKPELNKNLVYELFTFASNLFLLKYANFQKIYENDSIQSLIKQCNNNMNQFVIILENLSYPPKQKPMISIHQLLENCLKKNKNKKLHLFDVKCLFSRMNDLKDLINFDALQTDIKSNFSDLMEDLLNIEEMLDYKKYNSQKFEDAFNHTSDFLVILKSRILNSVVDALNSVLYNFKKYKKTMKMNTESFNENVHMLKEVIADVCKISKIASYLCSSDTTATEILFSYDKIDLITQKIIQLCEYYMTNRSSVTAARDTSFFTCFNYLANIWNKALYMFLKEVHNSFDFKEYFSLIEDVMFALIKKTLKSANGTAEEFKLETNETYQFLNYALCFARDKFAQTLKPDDSVDSLNQKVSDFKSQKIRKFDKIAVEIYNEKKSSKEKLLSRENMEKLEKILSKIQLGLHEFHSVFNIFKIDKSISENIKEAKINDENDVKIEQIYKQSNIGLYSSIIINNMVCLTTDKALINFVILNEYGNSVVNIKSFEFDQTDEIVNFMKCINKNSLILLSFISDIENDDAAVPEALINHLSLTNSKIINNVNICKDENHPSAGYIMIGYVDNYGLLSWYKEQFKNFDTDGPIHIFNEKVPSPLAHKNLTKIEISLKSNKENVVESIDEATDFAKTPSIFVNGVNYLQNIQAMNKGFGYCYIFENIENPTLGQVTQLHCNDITDFISNMVSGSIACMAFTNGLDFDDNEEFEKTKKVLMLDESVSTNNSIASIVKNNNAEQFDVRSVAKQENLDFKFTQYINNLSNGTQSIFIDTNEGDSQNNQTSIKNMIKSIDQNRKEQLCHLNQEFDQMQMKFIKQVEKSRNENIISQNHYENDQNYEKTIVGYSKQISVLVSYLVDLTRNRGPLKTDESIITNCNKIKNLGEELRSLCIEVADACKDGSSTKNEIISSCTEFPLYLHQLSMLSKVKYGSDSNKNGEDAIELTSSLITTSTNIMKTIINLIKSTQSANIEYKLNFNISPAIYKSSNYSNLISSFCKMTLQPDENN